MQFMAQRKFVAGHNTIRMAGRMADRNGRGIRRVAGRIAMRNAPRIAWRIAVRSAPRVALRIAMRVAPRVALRVIIIKPRAPRFLSYGAEVRPWVLKDICAWLCKAMKKRVPNSKKGAKLATILAAGDAFCKERIPGCANVLPGLRLVYTVPALGTKF